MSKNGKKRTNSITSEDDLLNNKKLKNNMSEQVIIINKNIKSLDDLIEIGSSYQSNKKYNINVEKLSKITPLLIKLKNIIGMETVKTSIIGQIIYFLQDFQNKNEDMLHTVIQGPPGVGKTMLGHIIGEIYWELDIIQSPNIINDYFDDYYDDYDDCDNDDDNNDHDFNPKNISKNFKNIIKTIKKSSRNTRSSKKKKEFKFKIAKRSDLIGKFLGHTAAKTQEVINEALGGVLFIDEAYSLGNPEGRDSFAKECIDTINQNLTEKKNELLVIIAGYEDALETCFFSYNEGLNRRFPFRYTIDSYTPGELSKIFCKMVGEINKEPKLEWNIDISNEKLDYFFKENYKLFPNFGGDIETFLLTVKIQHGIRVFCLPTENKRKINHDDLLNAVKIYRVNKELKDKNYQMTKYLQDTMYI